MVDTQSTSDPAQKTIVHLCLHNTSNTFSKKECKKDGACNPVHDEWHDAIASHQISMFLVQSHIGQEEGQTTMVDNVLMEWPAQVTIGNKNTQDITDTPYKNIFDK